MAAQLLWSSYEEYIDAGRIPELAQTAIGDAGVTRKPKPSALAHKLSGGVQYFQKAAYRCQKLNKCYMPPFPVWDVRRRPRERFHNAPGVMYAHITKAGSTTLRSFVRRQLNGSDGFLQRNDTQEWERPHEKHALYYKRAFVRPPMERFVAGVMEVISERGYPSNQSQSRQGQFDDFVVKFLDGKLVPHRDVPEHLQSQVRQLCHADGSCPEYEYIGSTQTISQELSLLHHTTELPQMHRKSKYTKPNIRRVHVCPLVEVYRNDYCCLGFKFPEICGDICSSFARKVYDWI